RNSAQGRSRWQFKYSAFAAGALGAIALRRLALGVGISAWTGLALAIPLMTIAALSYVSSKTGKSKTDLSDTTLENKDDAGSAIKSEDEPEKGLRVDLSVFRAEAIRAINGQFPNARLTNIRIAFQ